MDIIKTPHVGIGVTSRRETTALTISAVLVSPPVVLSVARSWNIASCREGQIVEGDFLGPFANPLHGFDDLSPVSRLAFYGLLEHVVKQADFGDPVQVVYLVNRRRGSLHTT